MSGRAMSDRRDDEPAAPLRAALERPSMALSPREAGLHLWPHDSIGSVNERLTCAASPVGRDGSTPEACDGRVADGRRRTGCSASSSGAASSTRRRPGLPARLATGRPIAGYIGFDPSGDVAPRRPPRADLRAAPPPALRRPAGRARGWRDRDDRRSVGAVERAQPARPRDPRGERRRDPRPARAVPRLHAGRRAARSWSTTSTGSGELSLIDFLRDTGKHFTVPYMLAKDSVQVRLERGPVVHRVQLHAPAGVRLRPPVPDDGRRAADGRRRPVGQHHGRSRSSSAGRRRRATTTREPAHGLAYKLLLSPSGAKFGKSEGGESVWLDAQRTSPYAFYQYWLNTDDRDVGTYLRWFTELTARRDRGARGRSGRARPRRAAPSGRWRVTSRPGPTEPRRPTRAIADSEAKFSAGAASTTLPSLASLYESAGGFTFAAAAARRRRRGRAGRGRRVRVASGEARRMIAGGGVTVNGQRVADAGATSRTPIAGEWLDVRIGKRRREIGRRAELGPGRGRASCGPVSCGGLEGPR